MKPELNYVINQGRKLWPLDRRRLIVAMLEDLMSIDDDVYETFSRTMAAIDQPETIMVLEKRGR